MHRDDALRCQVLGLPPSGTATAQLSARNGFVSVGGSATHIEGRELEKGMGAMYWSMDSLTQLICALLQPSTLLGRENLTSALHDTRGNRRVESTRSFPAI